MVNVFKSLIENMFGINFGIMNIQIITPIIINMMNIEVFKSKLLKASSRPNVYKQIIMIVTRKSIKTHPPFIKGIDVKLDKKKESICIETKLKINAIKNCRESN